jgi:hypothetical protein
MATHSDMVDAFRRLTEALRPLDDTDDGLPKADAYRDRVVALVDAVTAQVLDRKPEKCHLHKLVPPCTGCAGDAKAAPIEPAVNPANARANGVRPVVERAQAHTRRNP